jgi:hypothetical protein
MEASIAFSATSLARPERHRRKTDANRPSEPGVSVQRGRHPTAGGGAVRRMR